MADGPVVANNTPLAALWAIGRLDLLQDLFGKILIPQEVANEFLAVDQFARKKDLDTAPWIQVDQVRDRRRVVAYANLDLGEAEVLALGEEKCARLLVLDEVKGRRFARRMGVPIIGTLGVVLLAKEEGLLESVAPVIEQLQDAGFYLAPDLVSRALELADEG